MLLLSFNHTSTPEIYTLSLHDALPIYIVLSGYPSAVFAGAPLPGNGYGLLSLDDVATQFSNAEEVVLDGSGQTIDYLAPDRSEEHTSELQSQFHLVCRLLLEKKKAKAD